MQAELLRVPKEVSLSGSYATESRRIDTEAGMFNRTPGAELTLAYPDATNPTWTVGLRIDIVIDQSTLPAIETTRQRLDAARDEDPDVATLERDLDRAHTAQHRAQGALLSAWNGYVTQVNAYLALAQGGVGGEVRTPGARPWRVAREALTAGLG